MMIPPLSLDRLHRCLVQAWHAHVVILKAASFAVIGLINTLVDLGVFLTAYNIFKLSLLPANVLAWLIAVSGSYVMNSFITFAAESGRRLTWPAYGAFVACGFVGVIANTATLLTASYWMPVLAAKLLAILAGFVVNFSLSHFIVFQRRSPLASARSPDDVIERSAVAALYAAVGSAPRRRESSVEEGSTWKLVD